MMNWSHVPNALTVSRMVGVMAILLMAPYHTNAAVITAVTLYTLLCLTDYLDGWLARRLSVVSEFGKIMDPLADKLLILVFLPLLQVQVIHFFPVFLVVAREFLVMGLRVFAAKKGLVLAATWSGKLKTAVTLPVAGILLARIPVEMVPLAVWQRPLEPLRAWVYGWPSVVIEALIGAMVLVTVASLIDYIRVYRRALHAEPSAPAVPAKRGEGRMWQRGLSWLPNVITLANMGCGLAAIAHAIGGHTQLAAGLVLIGVYFDSLDGRLARRLNAFTDWGAKLDSKADFVTFGLAPATLMVVTVSQRLGPNGWWAAVALGLVHYAAVHFRLRRFDRTGHADYFEGLPSPIGASAVVVLCQSTVGIPVTVLVPLLLVLAGLMASTIPYPHLSAALKKPVLNALKLPALCCFLGTIGGYLGAARWVTWYLPEGLLVCMLVYGLSPWMDRS